MSINYKISIIIPVFNIEKYISSCLDSVLTQTYKNLEILIINDGSTDNSKEIIENYATKDNRIIVINKENGGVTSARNVGLKLATGDYIGFVDGDDYIEPNMFELLIKNAVDNNADISHCGCRIVFPSRVDYYYNTNEKILQSNKDGLKELILGSKIEPSMCNKLYKSDIIKDKQIDSKFISNEDYLFNIYAFKSSKVSYYEDKALYHYQARINSAASSKIDSRKIKNSLDISRIIMNELENYDDELFNLAKIRFVNNNVSNFNAIIASKDKNLYEEFVNTIVQNLKNIKLNNEDSISTKTKMMYNLILFSPTIAKLSFKLFRVFNKESDRYEVK